MTALVAIRVPSKALNPKRRQISCVEPGVILAADTRITKGTRPLDGDGRKLGKLPGSAIAGFSGDVYVADTALERLTASVEANQSIDHFELATMLQKQLARTRNEIVDRKPIRTTVVLGTFFDTPRLYVLDTKDNFTPQLRDGLEFAGSGADALQEQFAENVDWMTQNWHNRARQPQFAVTNRGEIRKVSTEGKEPFPIRLIDLVNIVCMSLEGVFVQNKTPSVGGKIQCVVLRKSGASWPIAMGSGDDGKTWQRKNADTLLRAKDMGINASTDGKPKEP